MRERWEQCWEGEERDGKCGERGNRRNGKGQGEREMNGMERRGEKRGKVRGRRQKEGRGVRRAKERR